MLFRIIMKILAFFILLISTSSFAGEYETNFNIEKFNFAQKNGKIVVIHSWNKSCNTCAKQKPIMEKAKNIVAIPFSTHWSDLGDWNSAQELLS